MSESIKEKGCQDRRETQSPRKEIQEQWLAIPTTPWGRPEWPVEKSVQEEDGGREGLQKCSQGSWWYRPEIRYQKTEKANFKFKNGLDYSELNTSLGYLERPWSRDVGLWWRTSLKYRMNPTGQRRRVPPIDTCAVPCTLRKPWVNKEREQSHPHLASLTYRLDTVNLDIEVSSLGLELKRIAEAGHHFG
jgi:hypothetical protein